MVQKVLGGILLATLFLGVLVACYQQDQTIAFSTRPSVSGITQGVPRSAKAFEQRAIEVAREWHPDAYLIGVNVIVSASRPDGTFTIVGKVSFDFRSKRDTQNWYAVDLDSNEALRVFEFSYGKPHPDYVPIEPKDWTLDSTDVWQIVQSNGGKVLLEKYQQQTIDMRCSLSLGRWNPPRQGQVIWHVNCTDVVTEKWFDFWIDAQTGEVIEKEVK